MERLGSIISKWRGQRSANVVWVQFWGDSAGRYTPVFEMRDVDVKNADEWMSAMKELPETKVKEAFASLLSEPTKKDWGR